MKGAPKLAALFLSLCYLVLSSGLAYADTRPYFKSYGADVFAGGWSNNGANACVPSADTYQAPNYSGPSNLYKGGVMAYGKSDRSGASSQHGALALGIIEGNTSSGEPYGFSSGGGSYNKLSFANFSSLSATNYWGGFWEGTTRQTHCVPDYFNTKQNSSIQSVSSIDNVSNLNSGQYKVTPSGILSIGNSGTLGAGKKVTIFVDGNAFISNNITYAARSSYTADNTPKFALVVRGSIYIAPDVSQLDGLYVAQPNLANENAPTADTGVIWTCHTNSTDNPTGAFVSQSCRNKLTFNGAVIAKQVNLLRANGDVATANPSEDASNGNIAEVFNFTPEMVVGGGFFNPSTKGGQVQNIISLPPVF